jgi:cytochrome c5
MSQAPHSQDDGPIQTPRQLMLAIVLAFVVPVVVIALLVNYVNSVAKEGAGSNALAPEAVAQRIMPVAAVQVKAATVAAGSRKGEEVYKAQCASCHDAGALGSPKFGDAAAWGGRIGQGLETLATHALKGFNAMPPQGGGEFADVEITRAAAYMANAGGAKFEEPPVVAAAADAASEAK